MKIRLKISLLPPLLHHICFFILENCTQSVTEITHVFNSSSSFFSGPRVDRFLLGTVSPHLMTAPAGAMLGVALKISSCGLE